MFKFIRLAVCLVVFINLNTIQISAQYPYLERTLTFKFAEVIMDHDVTPRITVNGVSTNLTHSPWTTILSTSQELNKIDFTAGVIGDPPDEYKCTYTYHKTYATTPLFNQEITIIPRTIYGSCGDYYIDMSVSLRRKDNVLKRTNLPWNVPLDYLVTFDVGSDNFDSKLNEKLHIELTAEGTTTPVLANFDLLANVKSFKLSEEIKDPTLLASLFNKNLSMRVSYLSNIVTYASSDKSTAFTMRFVDRVDLPASIVSGFVYKTDVRCNGDSTGFISISKVKLVSGNVINDLSKLRYVVCKKVIDNNDGKYKWYAIAPSSSGYKDTTDTVAGGVKLALTTKLKAGIYLLKVWGQDIGVGSYIFENGNEIKQPDFPLTYIPTRTDPQCSIGTGSVIINASGGNVGDFQIKVDTLITQDPKTSPATYSDLSIGSHSVKVLDSKGCVAKSPPFTILSGTDPVLTINNADITQPACIANPNGIISCTVNDIDHPDYTYYVNDKQQINYPIQGLNAGIKYIIKVTDNRGCTSDTVSKTLSYDTAKDPKIISYTINQPKCSDVKGSINIFASKSRGSQLTYSCTGQTDTKVTSDNYTFGNLGEGNYSIYVTDDFLCPSTTMPITPDLAYTNTLSVSATPVLNGTSTTYHLTCNGDDKGEISVIATSTQNNISTYSLLSNLIPTSATYNSAGSKFDARTAGKYMVKIEAADGCTKTSAEIELIQPSKVTIIPDSVISNPVICHGGNDGKITIRQVTGGSGNYSYSFDNASTFSIDNFKLGLTAKSYNLVAKDNLGCLSSVFNKAITEPDILTISSLSPVLYVGNTHVSCNGISDGRIAVDITGGTAMYTAYLFHSGDAIAADFSNAIDSKTGITALIHSATFTGLPIGDYKAVVADANGCITNPINASLTNEPSELGISDVSLSTKPGSLHHISCNGYNNGTIKVDIQGGTLPYTVFLKKLSDNSIQQRVISAGLSTVFDSTNNLTVGVYQVRVIDANGCQYPYDTTYELTQPDIITANLPASPAKNHGFYIPCHGNNISLSPVVLGGNGGYTFTWSNGQYQDTARGLGAGPVSVSVSDRFHCPAASDAVILNHPPQIYFTNPIINRPKCAYSSDGEIEINAFGGVPSFIFTNFNNGEILSLAPIVFKGLGDGKDSIRVMDQNGCTHDTTVNVIDNPALGLAVSDSAIPHCHGGDDGWLKIRGFNGQKINGTDYKFNLFDKNTSQLLNSVTGDSVMFGSLNARQYSVTIIDDYGCTNTIDPKIEDALQIMVDISSTKNTCYNDSTAEIVVKASGAYKPYYFAYEYDNHTFGYKLKDDSTLVLSKLNWNKYNHNDTSKYNFHIYDSHNTPGQPCISNITFTLPIIKKMNVDVLATLISCRGSNDASMKVNQVDGAQGNVSYQWSGPKDGINAITTSSITNLGPDTYTVTVKDTNQCEFSFSQTFLNPLPLSVTLINAFAESGLGENDGKAIFRVTGSRDTISYWLDNEKKATVLENGSFRIDSVWPGLHRLSISNPSTPGCRDSVLFKIKHQPPSLIIVLNGKLDATPGKADGRLKVNASGGAGGYRYYWFNELGDTLKIFNAAEASALGKGIYSVVVMDNDSVLSNVVTETINESDTLALIQDSIAYPTCRQSPNGLVRVAAYRGARPYTYWWTNASGTAFNSDSIAMALLPGRYIAHVKDARNTEISIDINVAVKDTIYDILTQVISPGCYNNNSGVIKVEKIQGGSGSYSYLWSTGSTTRDLTGVGIGTYKITVYDNAVTECYFEKNVTITTQPSALSLHIDSVMSPTCRGGANGKIYISANGGTKPYAIIWPGNTVTGHALFNASVGTHTALVTDYNGCTASAIATVENPFPLLFNAGVKQPLCNGENNGNISITMLNGRAGYLAKWTPDLHTSNLKVSVPAGIFAVEITDADGCKVDSSFVVSQPLALKVDSFTYSIPLCSGSSDGTIKASLSGGTSPSTYKWSNYQNGQTATKLIGGKYSVAVTDHNNCHTSAQAELKTPEVLKINEVFIEQPVCSGYGNGTLTILATGGTGIYTYFINTIPATRKVENLYANKYSILVRDANNCAANKNVQMNQPSPLMASALVQSIVKCAGECNGELAITASGSFAPYKALWPDGTSNFTRNDLCAGPYNVIITDDHNCQIRKYLTMGEPNVLTLNSYLATVPTCFEDCDGKLEATYSGGTQPYKVNWDNGHTSNIPGERFFAPNLCAGDFKVTLTDHNNCKLTHTFVVPQTPKVTIASFPVKFQLCEGQQNLINPGTWSAYSWYFNKEKVSDTSVYNANKNGHYILKVISDKGCVDSAGFEVQVSKDLLSANFLIPNDAITDDTVEIVDVSWPVPDSISWQFSSDKVQIISKSHDRQQLVFKDAGEYSVKLIARKSLCLSENNQTIIVYNTPNERNDGKHPLPPQGEIEELYLYPNPSSGSFTVKVKLSDIGKIHMQILKMSVNTVIATKDGENSDLYEFPFDLPGLIPGVYLLNVQTNSHSKTLKFVMLK